MLYVELWPVAEAEELGVGGAAPAPAEVPCGPMAGGKEVLIGLLQYAQ